MEIEERRHILISEVSVDQEEELELKNTGYSFRRFNSLFDGKTLRQEKKIPQFLKLYYLQQ